MTKSIRDLLIEALEALPLLEGRFSNIKCVNYSGPSHEKKGLFSLVFSCHDQEQHRPAALKFFDPEYLADIYRLRCFEREPTVLTRMFGKKRCLQLMQEVKLFDLKVAVAGGYEITLHCNYFAIEWMNEDVEDYFLNQQSHAAHTKLLAFRRIVLATEALHRLGVFHRDLKPENLRAELVRNEQMIKAIDMGTAAMYDVQSLLSDYKGAVGDRRYSSPEACCGLAGDRRLARYSDYYALGCMLFELFNQDYFYIAQRRMSDFATVLAAIAIDLNMKDTAEEKYRAWLENVRRFKHAIVVPNIGEAGSSAPRCICAELNYILRKLVSLDMADRVDDLEWVRARVTSAIHVLKAHQLEKERIAERRRRRELRSTVNIKELRC